MPFAWPTRDRDAYAYLVRALHPYRATITLVLGLIVVTSILEGLSFSLIVPMVQVLSDPEASHAGQSGLLGRFHEYLSGYPVPRSLALLGAALFGLFLLKNGLQYLRTSLSAKLWLGISADTRRQVLERTMARPYGFFLGRKQGRLVEHLYHEPNHFSYAVQAAIEQFSNMLTMAVLLGLLVALSWRITILLGVFGLVYALIMRYFSHLTHADGPQRQEAEGEALALVTESIAGIRQVKVFAAADRIVGLYAHWIGRLRRVLTRHWIVSLAPARINEVFWVTVLSLLLWLPALGLVDDPRTIMPILALSAAVGFRMGPYFAQMGQGWLTLKFFLPAARVVAELLAPDETEHPAAAQAQFSGLREAIQFEAVTFSYDRGAPALQSVTLALKQGTTTAIVGPSGSGKSTLVDLLIRFFQPDAGRILVDGVDLRAYNQESWLRRIGFVSQDTFIFHGTIRENLALSKPDASFEEIAGAARLAHAHGFIERLPQGYDTMVGDRGMTLSGGERQRLAIARALLRNPDILILDEATSALDNRSEAEVQAALEDVAKDRTVIVVAHRLSTVRTADHVVVMDRGRVADIGTHDALLKAGGVYSALYAAQIG